MIITKQIEIDMAHRLPGHKSKCRNLHGHRYKIIVGIDDKIITTKGISEEGMVLDFSTIKEIMIKVLDEKFDHGAIFYSKDPYREYLESMINLGLQNAQKIHFVDFIPTVENLSTFWFGLIKKELDDIGIILSYIKVYETPTSAAICKTNDYTLTIKNI